MNFLQILLNYYYYILLNWAIQPWWDSYFIFKFNVKIKVISNIKKKLYHMMHFVLLKKQNKSQEISSNHLLISGSTLTCNAD